MKDVIHQPLAEEIVEIRTGTETTNISPRVDHSLKGRLIAALRPWYDHYSIERYGLEEVPNSNPNDLEIRSSWPCFVSWAVVLGLVPCLLPWLPL